MTRACRTISRSANGTAPKVDPETLFDLRDELDRMMDEMERLKEDYHDRFADRPSTDEAGEYTEEDVPDDLERTCI